MDCIEPLKRAIATARRQLRRGRYDAAETALDAAAGHVEELTLAIARELQARADLEHERTRDAELAAARAGAEAGALRVEVRRLCAELEPAVEA
jgi:hypothetical protein